MNFVYKRVSTEKQDLRRQEEAFKNIKMIVNTAINSPAAMPTGRS